MENPYLPEMALLIRREKQIEERLLELKKDFGLWKDRIELARSTGRDELASRAEERVNAIRREASKLREELRLSAAKRKRLRMESRRPGGEEVERAEALLESFRQSGLIDPDEASLQSEFDKLKRAGFHDEQ